MPFKTNMYEAFQNDTDTDNKFYGVTIGTVVDTNDPQQNSRVRVICPSFGESLSTNIEDIPWTIVSHDVMGTTEVGTRGPDLSQSRGPIAYGFWGVPKLNAQVLIMCIDGDMRHRVFMGCVPSQLNNHTMPHGRWTYDEHPATDGISAAYPKGPFTTTEYPIEPLSTNFKLAFGDADINYEWRTRAADYSVSAVDIEHLNATYSKIADDKDVQFDGWTSRQGYQASRLDPLTETTLTQNNYDSLVYSFVTPGFHGISMDDRQENCRIRARTTSGHQIIMDDTNERIYISTAQGKNWIEMDQQGNICMYTDNKVSIRSKQDINLTSDASIRLTAGDSIHMKSGNEIRVQAANDVHFKFEGNLQAHVSQQTNITTDGNLNLLSRQNVNIESSSNFNIKSGSNLNLESGSNTNQKAGGNIIETATQIHHNGPAAASAGSATPAAEQPAMLTNMVPNHEPWARTMTANDFTHEPEFAYNSNQVGKVERGKTFMRGRFWRR